VTPVTPVTRDVTDARVTVQPPQRSDDTGSGVVAIAVGLLAMALAVVGFYQNAVFLFGFGRVMDAAGSVTWGRSCCRLP
jgi:hypothetical protein